MALESMTEQQVIYTVSQLNNTARQILEDCLATVWLTGEISNFSVPSSGHMYFTLKDETAQVRCALFKNRNRLLNFRPQNGLHVLVKAQVSLYEARGEYQLIIEAMQEAGSGALQRAFEQLKQRLLTEGLFDAAHKKPLPELPKQIGIITSPTGAAIHDILTVLKRRFPLIPIIIYPTQVQGAPAAAQIAGAIATANVRNECDILILARGGGSLEDLWPFNEEAVARAIFHSQLPIVTGIGHEVDTTIADFVADHRAATPSAAAEYISPDQASYLTQVAQQKKRLFSRIEQLLQYQQHLLTHLQKRLRHPGERIREQTQQLDYAERALLYNIQKLLQLFSSRVITADLNLQKYHPNTLLVHYRDQVNTFARRLPQAVKRQLLSQQERLQHAARTLQAISPLATLERGYSITIDTNNGRIIRNTSEIQVGSQITTRLSEGNLISVVTEVQEGTQNKSE